MAGPVWLARFVMCEPGMEKYTKRRLGREFWLPGVITGLMTAISFGFIMTAALLGCRTAADPGLLVTSFARVERQGMAGTTAAVRIRFSGAVVEDPLVGLTLKTSPVTITPAVKVAARWRDRRTLVLRPTAPMRPSTRYRVTLSNLPLAGETRFSFVHRPLAVTRLSGADPARLPRRPTLVMHFNQPVLAGDVARSCALRRRRGQSAPALTTPHRTAVTSAVVLRPLRPLPRNVSYTLRCAGLRGHGGDAPLARPYVQRLRTRNARLARRRR